MREKFNKVMMQVFETDMSNVKEETLLREELGIDSLRLVMLITAIEEEFEFEFEESDLDPNNLVNVGDILSLISKRYL